MNVPVRRIRMGSQGNGQGRSLNVTGIKKIIVFVAGAVTALGSALTGLGAQMAFGPMLQWMLGFGPEKATGTAARYALLVAFCATLGICWRNPAMAPLLLNSLLLFVGAILGALVTGRWSPQRQQPARRRFLLSLGIALMLLVVLHSAQRNLFSGDASLNWHSGGYLPLIGLVAGAITQVLGLPSGMLLIVALVYLGGYKPYEAIVMSQGVVFFALLLPTLGYARRGLVDAVYAIPIALGALLGGVFGGYTLIKIGSTDPRLWSGADRTLMVLSAAVAMLLCGRELARPVEVDPAAPSSSTGT